MRLCAALLLTACSATPVENLEMALEDYSAGEVGSALEYINTAQKQVSGADLIQLKYLEEQVSNREADHDCFYLSMERLRFR